MQIVTLTTDYGNSDFYVAELKGVILSTTKETQIVDISHNILSYDIVQAAFFVRAVYEKFPAGTIHIISVYNYHDHDSGYVITKQNDHYFIAPNNGVLSLIFEQIKDDDIIDIDFPTNQLSKLFAHGISAIQHGLPIEELGSRRSNFIRKMGIQPVVTSQQLRVTIIHVDHYENVIVNLTKSLFDKIRDERPFSLYYKQTEPITSISQNYGDVEIGETLCLFNSAGYMEIAVNMGKASTMYNLNKNETIQINFHE